MGVRRTGHFPLGRVAVMKTKAKIKPVRPRAVFTLVATLGLGAGIVSGLGGCASVGATSGAVAGMATGAVTANPAVGIGVGIAVQAATDAAIKYVMRDLHDDQQELMAADVGKLPVGGTTTWKVHHKVPLENGQGRIYVTRAFMSPLATCKEFLFSVADGDKPDAKEQWFTANACRADDGTWKWAVAEPAVERWGSLQ